MAKAAPLFLVPTLRPRVILFLSVSPYVCKDIVSPDAVTIEMLDGDADVAVVSYKAIKAA